MEAEVEVEVGVEEIVDLSAGVDSPKNYDEPGPCRSAAHFLLGEEMEGDPPGREEMEGGAAADVDIAVDNVQDADVYVDLLLLLMWSSLSTTSKTLRQLQLLFMGTKSRMLMMTKLSMSQSSRRCQRGGRLSEGARKEVVIESLGTEAKA